MLKQQDFNFYKLDNCVAHFLNNLTAVVYIISNRAVALYQIQGTLVVGYNQPKKLKMAQFTITQICQKCTCHSAYTYKLKPK